MVPWSKELSHWLHSARPAYFHQLRYSYKLASGVIRSPLPSATASLELHSMCAAAMYMCLPAFICWFVCMCAYVHTLHVYGVRVACKLT